MFCHECGTKISEGGTFCGNCGAKVNVVVPEAPEAVEEVIQPEKPPVTMEEMKTEQQEQLIEPEIVTGGYTAPKAEVDPIPVAAPIPAAAPTPTPAPRPTVQQTQGVDSRDLPMTLGGWIGTMLILLIPIVNIIMPFVWAFGGDVNRSKKTFFQAMLLANLVGIILIIVFSSAIAVFIASLSESIFY